MKIYITLIVAVLLFLANAISHYFAFFLYSYFSSYVSRWDRFTKTRKSTPVLIRATNEMLCDHVTAVSSTDACNCLLDLPPCGVLACYTGNPFSST